MKTKNRATEEISKNKVPKNDFIVRACPGPFDDCIQDCQDWYSRNGFFNWIYPIDDNDETIEEPLALHSSKEEIKKHDTFIIEILKKLSKEELQEQISKIQSDMDEEYDVYLLTNEGKRILIHRCPTYTTEDQKRLFKKRISQIEWR